MECMTERDTALAEENNIDLDLVTRTELETTYWLSHNEDDAQALQYLHGLAKLHKITLGSRHAMTLSSHYALAMRLLAAGQYEAAERLLKTLRSIQISSHGVTHKLTLQTVYALGLLAKRQHRLNEAESWLCNAYNALTQLRPRGGQLSLQLAEISYARGVVFVQCGLRCRAVSCFQIAHDSFDAELGPGDVWTTRAAECEALCVESQLQQSLFPKHFTTAEGRFRSKNAWKTLSQCALCARGFGVLFPRRHHCRVCGDSVCGRCSRHRTLVLEFHATRLSRMCDQCFLRGF